ncbi:MAG: NrfD/PsrC family molybdoenzyme membrane anchor subunit [Verrucomicrobiota bacterium]
MDFLIAAANTAAASDLPNQALTNFVYANEEHILWSLMIVIYPYMTGIIAGAFVVSSLYHVFQLQAFKSIARFALVFSFCFGAFAGLPLTLHLTQPFRAFNIFLTPHFTAAMSVFGYVYGTYMVILTIEIWLVYREFFVRKANETKHIIWKILTLGVNQVTPESLAVDKKLIGFLAGLGIPVAFILHGYVGFIFGSIKAVAWWATPLQPIIFLASAVVSGIAMLLLAYTFLMKRRPNRSIDPKVIKTLAVCLWMSFFIAFALELLEVGYAYFEHGHHWTLIGPLLSGPLYNTYVIWQIGIFSFPPIIILGFVVLGKLRNGLMIFLANVAALLLVLQVLFMRYNVVIGGQFISRSDRGFAEFHWHWFGREGILMTVLVFLLPFFLFAFLSRYIPIFPGDHPNHPKASTKEDDTPKDSESPTTSPA